MSTLSNQVEIENIYEDLKSMLIYKLIKNEHKKSQIPIHLRSECSDRFLEIDPIPIQVWLILTSNLDDLNQAHLMLKLFMYRNVDPISWLHEWIGDSIHDPNSGHQIKSINQLMDQAVEKPLLIKVKERQHVAWLLRAVTSQESLIASRLNRLWSQIDLLETAKTSKQIWQPLLQYTLKWRSTGKKNDALSQKLSLELQKQIEELSSYAVFEDFEMFINILSERYREVDVQSEQRQKGDVFMDNRMRILRRFSFWFNYRNQIKSTRFFINQKDYTEYQISCMDELLYGDEFISICDDLPMNAPIMALEIKNLIIYSSLTEPKRPTFFLPINKSSNPVNILSIGKSLNYNQLDIHIDGEPSYYHKYLWQVLFSLILEGANISPDDPQSPFILGGDKTGEYIIGAGLKFKQIELDKQESQLTDLLRENQALISHLSQRFGEELSVH